MELLKQFYAEEEGMGVIEIVMIIAALMCVALLFRKQIVKFAGDIMETIFDTGNVPPPSADG